MNNDVLDGVIAKFAEQLMAQLTSGPKVEFESGVIYTQYHSDLDEFQFDMGDYSGITKLPKGTPTAIMNLSPDELVTLRDRLNELLSEREEQWLS